MATLVTRSAPARSAGWDRPAAVGGLVGCRAGDMPLAYWIWEPGLRPGWISLLHYPVSKQL
jgi:hypothetical protein